MKLKHSSVFVSSEYSALTSRQCTNYVQYLSQKLVGVRLSPLDYRHIRGTHFYHSVMTSEKSEEEKQAALSQYASCVGQTIAVLKDFYVYFNPQQLASVSITNTAYANSLLIDGLPSPLDITL